MKKIVLHIGAGKCGSSSLQAYLSSRPTMQTATGDIVKYGSVGVNGVITTGADLVEKARSTVFQYSSSVLLSNTDDDHFAANLSRSLNSINCDVLILSCEGWLGQSALANQKLKVLSDWEIEILVFVRPPVEWLNSAWWQWGAWNKIEFNNWFTRSVSSTYWSEYISGWQDTKLVDILNIRVLPNDIVEDFHNAYSISRRTEDISRSNTSLPGSVLRLFQKHSDLRPSAHEPQIDFTISRRLSELRSRPDWVMSNKHITQTIEATESYNKNLLQVMSGEQRNAMQCNPAWWDSSHYDSREYFDPAGRQIEEVEKDLILYHSLRSLHQAESEIVSLRNKVRRLRKKTVSG